MVVVLLWMWRAAMESFSARNGLSEPVMKPLMLPVAQLAVGGGCKQRIKWGQLKQGRLWHVQAQQCGFGQCIVHCMDAMGGQHRSYQQGSVRTLDHMDVLRVAAH
jgi:hypothetical protein